MPRFDSGCWRFLKMVDRFLHREVKRDGKGIYVHYGSYRLRPCKHNTLFKEKGLVSMMIKNSYDNSFIVFDNLHDYEIWKSKKQ